MNSKKNQTARIQKSLETRERFPISFFDSLKYIQHNLNLEDGLGPILAFMDGLPPNTTRVEVRRAFEDGDYSFAHADYLLGDWGAMVGFEIHRWENDRIVEHWDNLQSTPSAANPSGRSMTDGATQLSDFEYTQNNKALAAQFTDVILIGGAFDRASEYFQGAALIQHNPLLADGVEAWLNAVKTGFSGKGVRYGQRHKVLGDGNFVLVLSEGELSGNDSGSPVGLYDLYRIENGRIAEHWDVIERIPPRGAWKNGNGKF